MKQDNRKKRKENNVSEWIEIEKRVPEDGKLVEVQCVMSTRATYNSLEKPEWHQDSSEPMQAEVRLWREIKLVEDVQQPLPEDVSAQ